MSTNILKSLVSIIKLVISVFAIGFIAIILVQKFSNNSKSVLGYRIFNVVTESMVPKYQVGDVLLVKEKKVEEIQIGDDVTYMGKVGSFADKIVTHQVINVTNDNEKGLTFVTKGIANDKEDPLVYGDQIYGVVQTKIELVTKLNGVINNMYGMYFLIIIPLAIIMFTEFRSFKDDDKKNDEDDDDEEEEDDDDTKRDEKDDDDEKFNKKHIDKKSKKRKEKRAKRRRRYE